jgi:hypothetical protein
MVDDMDDMDDMDGGQVRTLSVSSILSIPSTRGRVLTDLAPGPMLVYGAKGQRGKGGEG